jgi:hypothetical protein
MACRGMTQKSSMIALSTIKTRVVINHWSNSSDHILSLHGTFLLEGAFGELEVLYLKLIVRIRLFQDFH